MDRRIAVAYSVLVALTTIFAAIAVAWFGPNSNLEMVPGILERFESVWSLFALPAVLAVIGLVGGFGLASTRVVYAPMDELSPDAQRGLESHRNAERRLLIGVGVLAAFGQLLVILYTAGFAVHFELGARTTFFVFGALFASAGNMIPKIPFFSRWWQIDRATYTTVARFSGWAIAIAGVSVCLVAVFAPMQYLKPSVATVIGSAMGLLLVHAIFQALIAARKSQ